jgi:hypothetical protein
VDGRAGAGLGGERHRVVLTVRITGMDGPIPVNHKFAIIAFERVYRLEFTEPFEIGRGLRFETRAPFPMPQNWVDWNGEIGTDHFQKANLFIIAHAPSALAGIVDAENEALWAVVHNICLGLALQCIPDCGEGAIFVGGGNNRGKLEVRQTGNITNRYKPLQLPHLPEITRAACENAAIMEPTIKSVCRTPYAIPCTPGLQLRFGLDALDNAMRQPSWEERLHQAARSIEAVVRPQKGNTTKQFRERTKMFAAAKDADTILSEIYGLRSAVEHLHMQPPDRIKALPPAEQESQWLLRTFQAEAIARDIYSRLLLDPAKLNAVCGQQAGQPDFWQMTDADRGAIWGQPLDLDAATTNAFTPRL